MRLLVLFTILQSSAFGQQPPVVTTPQGLCKALEESRVKNLTPPPKSCWHPSVADGRLLYRLSDTYKYFQSHFTDQKDGIGVFCPLAAERQNQLLQRKAQVKKSCEEHGVASAEKAKHGSGASQRLMVEKMASMEHEIAAQRAACATSLEPLVDKTKADKNDSFPKLRQNILDKANAYSARGKEIETIYRFESDKNAECAATAARYLQFHKDIELVPQGLYKFADHESYAAEQELLSYRNQAKASEEKAAALDAKVTKLAAPRNAP